ncbi:hypothetical protein O4157_14855 [Gordonia amicalis]|uniref:hypothetical protein n=1 Tax=Gordonia amicalis TaxID=89053 RepID=UPI0022B5A13F|nr:hypothetical protein [Gordonia amicalis]MCZ4652704.1 hypothetical protein [Gordonia amicalis]
MTAQQEAQRATMLADILREVRRITPHRGRADVEVHMREISARYVRLGGLQLPKRWQTIEQLDRIALRIRAGGATSVVEAISQLDHEAEIRRLDAANDDARWRSASASATTSFASGWPRNGRLTATRAWSRAQSSMRVSALEKRCGRSLVVASAPNENTPDAYVASGVFLFFSSRLQRRTEVLRLDPLSRPQPVDQPWLGLQPGLRCRRRHLDRRGQVEGDLRLRILSDHLAILGDCQLDVRRRGRLQHGISLVGVKDHAELTDQATLGPDRRPTVDDPLAILASPVVHPADGREGRQPNQRVFGREGHRLLVERLTSTLVSSERQLRCLVLAAHLVVGTLAILALVAFTPVIPHLLTPLGVACLLLLPLIPSRGLTPTL